MEVVEQKADADADDGNTEERRVRSVRQNGEREDGDAGYCRYAGGKSVKAVDEVDYVGKGHKIEHGYRVGEPSELDETPSKRIVDAREQQSRTRNDASRDDLPCQFQFRPKVFYVVCHADRKHDRHADRHADVVDREVGVGGEGALPPPKTNADEQDGEGDDESGEHRDASEPGDRPRVDPARARVIDGLASQGYSFREGNEDGR